MLGVSADSPREHTHKHTPTHKRNPFQSLTIVNSIRFLGDTHYKNMHTLCREREREREREERREVTYVAPVPWL